MSDVAMLVIWSAVGVILGSFWGVVVWSLVTPRKNKLVTLGASPHPGDVFYDETGIVSHCCPSTYVILSRDQSSDRSARWEYRCWVTTTSGGQWMGGPVVILWDADIARLRFVGTVPMGHL